MWPQCLFFGFFYIFIFTQGCEKFCYVRVELRVRAINISVSPKGGGGELIISNLQGIFLL